LSWAVHVGAPTVSCAASMADVRPYSVVLRPSLRRDQRGRKDRPPKCRRLDSGGCLAPDKSAVIRLMHASRFS
jgi:hypothetical protein